MRNAKSCPKCQSADVVRIESPQDASHNVITIGWFSAARVTRYLCAKCGFSEEWIEDPDELAKLVAKYRG
jgi:predicted nucleic-acid-binding Zn-ribbon protein